MTFHKVAVIAVIAVFAGPATLFGRQNIAANGSMEAGPGPGGLDPHVPADWTRFGGDPYTIERSDEANKVPQGEGHALKAFSSDPTIGAYQDVPVNPGDTVGISAWLYTRSDDKLSGDAEAGIFLEFYDAGDQLLDLGFVFVLDATSNGDTWYPGSVGPLTAPTGTVIARMTCVWRYFGSASGSAYWDDCRMSVNGGPNALINGDFETAGTSEQSPFGIDDWIGFNDQEKSDDVAFNGGSSLKLGVGAQYSGLWQNMGVLEEGDHIFMMARAMLTSNGLLGTARIGIKLEFDPVSSVPPPEENLSFDGNATSNAWVEVTLSTTVPEDMTVARIACIYFYQNGTTGSVYFDWASAQRGGQPGVNQLLNPSFEFGDGGLNGIDDWTEFSSPPDSTAQLSCPWNLIPPPYHGECMMKATGSATAGIYQEITVAPGETLDVSAYLYTLSDDKLTGPGRAGVKIEWSPGGVPEDIDIGGPTNTLYAADPADIWHELTIDYTMPAGSQALARFANLIEKGTATGGKAYFDGCEAVLLNRFDGADVDGDDDEDLADFARFQECYGVTPLGWPCYVFDLYPAPDGDGEINLADFQVFEQNLTGP